MSRSGGPLGSPLLSLADFLREHRAEVLNRWFTAVRDCTAASRLSEEEFVDHIPLLFDRLADAVDAITNNKWPAIPVEGAHSHALMRLSLGFDLREVVTELFLLRHVLLEIFWQRREPTGSRLEEVQTLGWAIDAAIRESVEAYTYARQRLLEALDRLSGAALESRSLDELLPRLLRVVFDTTAEVDTAAIFLVEGDRLRLRAAVGLEEELEAGFSLAFGEGLSGRVAVERRPLLQHRAAEDAVSSGPVFRAGGVQALYGLPLIVAGELLGVMHMGSLSFAEFSERDQAFLRAVADRAAAAVLQHKLREEAERAGKTRDEVLALLDGMYTTAPIGFAFCDRQLRFARVNDAFAAMTGVSREAHLGKRPSELLPVSAGLDVGEAGWRQILETGEAHLDVEIATEAPAGAPARTWLASWYPVRVRGEISGIGIIARDVTRERQDEQFRRHIVGIVSHDMRTPLQTIRLSADALLRGEDLNERQAKSVARIHASAGRLESIVRDLVDFTRAGAGQGLPIERRRVDLAAVCRRVVDEAQAAHPTRQFVQEHAGDLHGEWDAARLAQALANLTANGAIYSPEHTTVILRCADEGESISVEVENQGAPIGPDLLPQLFEPFRRGVRSEAGGGRGGLGLGLFITREIIRAHDGSIAVDSDAQRTVFRIRLPRRSHLVA